jgi:hypothetical protein
MLLFFKAAESNNKKLRSNVLALLKKDRSSFDILLRVASFESHFRLNIENLFCHV